MDFLLASYLAQHLDIQEKLIKEAKERVQGIDEYSEKNSRPTLLHPDRI